MATATKVINQNNLSIWKRSFALLQRLGKSLLFPIAMLPVAAIFLRLGAAIPGDTEFSAFIGQLFLAIGNAVFGTALPFLFAIGIAFGMTKDSRGEAAIVGFSVMVLLTVLLSSNTNNFKEVKTAITASGATIPAPTSTSVNFGGFDFVDKIYSGISLEGGKGFHGIFGGAYNSILAGNVFTGIFAGSIVAFIYNRFNGIEMPSLLGFFSGRRLIPVLSILTATILGLAWALIFPWFGVALHYVGEGLGKAQGNRWANGGIMFAFGIVNRLLIPFGLHHTINTPLWFTSVGGTALDAAGNTVNGDIFVFLDGVAPGNHSGTFQSGFFPTMMFGLPAIAFAIYWNAKNQTQKAKVASLFAGSALVSFFTGITEPIEFSFMFLAPVLYGVHAFLTGFFGFIVGIFGIQLGFGFSAGLIDYVLSIPKSMDIIAANKTGFNAAIANPAWIWVIGAAAAAAYFFSANFLIKRFNISTPGRGDNLIEYDANSGTASESKAAGSNKYTADAKKILKAVGGKANVKSLANCATRLRFVLVDNSIVDKNEIKKTKAMGQVKVQGGYQVIMGPTVEMYANEIQKML